MAASTRTDETAVDAAIDSYLRSGTTDPLMAAWPGDLRRRAERSHRELRSALIREVIRCTAGRTLAPLPSHDPRELTRLTVTPMVKGLFPTAERETVLQVVERSVIFVTSDNIEQLLMNQRWDHTAWMLANLHLGTLGADLLGPDATRLVGLSEETTCFVSPAYFSDPDPTSDFLVHEVAHIFHDCKRRAAGLPETRRSEWLLDIAFHKRETFAYACEFYAWVLKHSPDAAARRRLAVEICRKTTLCDNRVEPQEFADIVLDAALSRAGWKVILHRCGNVSGPLGGGGV
ncbi:MAG: hypothetical protein ACYDAL_17860 [Candidatus Dormibacteraceae bacterium]